MKSLYLILQRLKQYYSKNKTVFIVYIIGSVFCAVVVSYFYGNLISRQSERGWPEYRYRQYELLFSSPMAETINGETGEVLDYLTKYNGELDGNELLESVMVVHYLSGFSLDSWPCLTTCAYGEPKFDIVDGSGEFTGGDQVIIQAERSEQVGDTIVLADREFTVIGKYSNYRDFTHDDYYIPRETFMEMDITHDQIFLYAKEEQDLLNPENDPVRALILSTYNCGINDGGGLVVSDGAVTEDVAVVEAAQISVCYVISMISFMFLLSYLLDSLRNETIISMIVGASKWRVRIMVFIEMTVLTAFTMIAGMAIHKSLYSIFFEKINIREDIIYTLTDYTKIFLMMFILSCLVEIPFVWRYTRLSPADARRR